LISRLFILLAFLAAAARLSQYVPLTYTGRFRAGCLAFLVPTSPPEKCAGLGLRCCSYTFTAPNVCSPSGRFPTVPRQNLRGRRGLNPLLRGNASASYCFLAVGTNDQTAPVLNHVPKIATGRPPKQVLPIAAGF